MLRLTPRDDPKDQPESLPFPSDAVRRMGRTVETAPQSFGRDYDDITDPIRRVERALERVQSDFERLRAQFDGDDRPRAA